VAAAAWPPRRCSAAPCPQRATAAWAAGGASSLPPAAPPPSARAPGRLGAAGRGGQAAARGARASLAPGWRSAALATQTWWRSSAQPQREHPEDLCWQAKSEAGAGARAPRRAARAHVCPSARPWWTAGGPAPSGPAERSGAPPRPAPACWRPARCSRRRAGAPSWRARRPRSRPARSPRARPPPPAAPRRRSPARLRNQGPSAPRSLSCFGVAAPPQQCTWFTGDPAQEWSTRQRAGAQT